MLNFAGDDTHKGLFILNDNKQGIGINKFNYLDWEKIAKGMNFEYFEVVDGHDFDQLQAAWEFFAKAKKSVFVKVNTIKAYGLKAPNPDQALHYYSLSKTTPGIISPVKVIVEEMDKLLQDKNAVLFSAGMMYTYNLVELQKKFPNQVFDTGISEEIALIEAAAAANQNKTVYFMVYSSFAQRTYDQFVHDVVRNNSNINIIITGAGHQSIGDSHHGIYDLNMYNIFKNVRSYQPSSTGELYAAIADLSKHQGIKLIRCEDDILIDSKQPNINQWDYEVNLDAVKVLITYGRSYYDWKKFIIANNLPLGLVKATTLNPIDEKLLQKLIAENKQLYTYELVMYKNNLAANIRECFKTSIIKDFAFSQITIGRADLNEILKENHLDLDYVSQTILADK
ncbi:hypothetical protein [Spiroplasma clarkii]|nr:hypothetical protein [Spiroplasma clarkii]